METQQEVQIKAAQAYEELFVPALFRPLAESIINTIQIRSNDYILDVACGTGVLARLSKLRLEPEGKVVGLDINEGMLWVAAQSCPDIEWQKGSATELPFEDASFNIVLSQFGLMFFPDPQKALQEMFRVLKPGGSLVVAVWDAIENIPAYALLDKVYQRHLNTNLIATLIEPYKYGNRNDFKDLCLSAGILPVEIISLQSIAQFPGIRSMVLADIEGWFPRAEIGDMQSKLESIIRETNQALSQFIQLDGSVKFYVSAHIAVATKKP